MKITKIDRVACDVIREKFELKMTELQEEIGISFKMKGITYDTDGEGASFRTEIATGDATPKTVKDYNRYVGILELPILGTKIKLQGTVYKTAGFKAKARKNNIIINDVLTGREYVTSVETMKRCIMS